MYKPSPAYLSACGSPFRAKRIGKMVTFTAPYTLPVPETLSEGNAFDLRESRSLFFVFVKTTRVARNSCRLLQWSQPLDTTVLVRSASQLSENGLDFVG